MLKDGTYAAWFKTPIGQGTGIVHFADGKLWGRDSIMFYDGTYQNTGDRFTAKFRTRRHTAGHATVFGFDDLELEIEGTAGDKFVKATGTTDAAPGVVLEITLIPSQLPAPPMVSAAPMSKPDLSKLPKLPSRAR